MLQEQYQRQLEDHFRSNSNSPSTGAQQSSRMYQYTPTALLLQNLFRRRQPRHMYTAQNNSRNPEMESLTTATTVEAGSSPQSPGSPISSREENESQDLLNDDFYADINLLRNSDMGRQRDEDESSEYLSISNLSLNLSPERCETPPPAYRSIFEKD